MGKEAIALGNEHNVTIEGRRKMTLTGVTDVQSFDDTEVIMETVQGFLAVHGAELHIERLSLDNGQLQISGDIESLEYDARTASRGGLISRIFG